MKCKANKHRRGGETRIKKKKCSLTEIETQVKQKGKQWNQIKFMHECVFNLKLIRLRAGIL